MELIKWASGIEVEYIRLLQQVDAIASKLWENTDFNQPRLRTIQSLASASRSPTIPGDRTRQVCRSIDFQPSSVFHPQLVLATIPDSPVETLTRRNCLGESGLSMEFKSEQAMPDKIDAMEDMVDQIILRLLQQVDAIASKLWENSITQLFPETHQIPFLTLAGSNLKTVTTAVQQDDFSRWSGWVTVCVGKMGGY